MSEPERTYAPPTILDLSGSAVHGQITVECYCRYGNAPGPNECGAGGWVSPAPCKAGAHALAACYSGSGRN